MRKQVEGAELGSRQAQPPLNPKNLNISADARSAASLVTLDTLLLVSWHETKWSSTHSSISSGLTLPRLLSCVWSLLIISHPPCLSASREISNSTPLSDLADLPVDGVQLVSTTNGQGALPFSPRPRASSEVHARKHTHICPARNSNQLRREYEIKRIPQYQNIMLLLERSDLQGTSARSAA